VFGSIAAAEFLFWAMFTFWPVEQPGSSQNNDPIYSHDEVSMQDIVVTRQAGSPPAPPQPQVPVPVPNDEIVPEKIDLPENNQLSELPSESEYRGPGGTGDDNKVYSNPQKPPSLIKIVEPVVPEAAKKAGVKVEVRVSFLVNKQGNVDEATIARIKLFDKNGRVYKIVDHIGYDIPEATLKAALQWKFHPARQNGHPVKAYTEHIFSYGF